MNRRTVVVGSAALLAGLVLTASIVFGPPMMQEDPSQTSSDIGAAQSNQARDVTYTILQRGESDDDITRTVLRADRLQRLDRGVSRLTRPRAEMRYSPTRAMTLSADSADVIMVDNQPQRGTFTGNVVITLFEAETGQSLITDPDNPVHEQFVRLRVFLDEQTDFDLATNDIDTNGPVHVTARETDFFGQGLRLKYNTLRKRIEQLIITEGRYLMYNPQAQTPSSDEGTEEPLAKVDDEPRDAPSQYYLASFREQVLVREGDRSEMFGDDKLEFRFSLGQEAITPADPLTPEEQSQPIGRGSLERPANNLTQTPLAPAIPGWQLAQADSNTSTDTPSDLLPSPDHDSNDESANEPPQQEDSVTEDTENEPAEDPGNALPGLLAQPVTIPGKNLARSMFQHEPGRDIVVTWSGQLRLTPLSEKPDELIDEKDVQLHLQGPNAYAQTTRDGRSDRIEAGEIEYLLGAQLVNALAPPGKPIRITSSTLGSLEGTWLTLNQQTGKGTILGPGTITQIPNDEGESLNLTWSDRLELELYTQVVEEPSPDSDTEQPEEDARYTRPGQVRVVGLKSARFIGQVTATHPDFDMKTDQLDLAFRQPDEAAGQGNDPYQIVATGSAMVNARGDAEDERFAISAQSLTLGLASDAQGELHATNLRALLDVKIERPGSVLTARRTDVSFAPPQPSERSEQSDGQTKPYAKVSSMVATGKVDAKLDYEGRRVDLSADQLVADVEQDQLTLISDDPRNLAEVFDVDDRRRLSGKLIVMDDQAEQVRVSGPGALTAALEDPDLDSARLAVTWEQAMRFNNIESTARFEGKVNATSLRSTDQTELSADTVDLRFSPDPEHDPIRLLPGEAVNDNEDNAEPGETGNREIRSTVARGDVVFIASAFEKNQTTRPYNRVRIQGPELEFTNRPRTSPTNAAVETLVVDGAGVMLIEDYRSREQGEAENGDEAVSFTGRGATAFTWETKMSLDARSNTAEFIDKAQMIHRPRDEQDRDGEPVELYCQKLVADMEDGGGLGVWMSDNAPDAEITTIHADRDVRLLRGGKEMLGDHLKYIAAKQKAELWADDGKKVIINDRETDTPARADRAIWDLAKDRIELRGSVGGSAPAQ